MLVISEICSSYMTDPETFTASDGEERVKDAEYVLPVVTGTAAFHLGKKATEHSSHRWTVYVRSLENENISHIIKKVVFQLHASFQTPTRELLQPPYELTEHGWGEFDIVITLHFTDDSKEPPVEMYHKLRLYPEDAAGQVSKKAVVHEQLEELVFSEPLQAFYQRLTNQVPMPAPPYSVAPNFTTIVTDHEAQRYNNVRRKVAQMRTNLQRQLDMAT